MMLTHGIDRGEDDRRQRSTDRQMREDRLIETLQGETEHQHRDKDDPAANPEQPGQHARTGAQRQIKQKFHDRLPDASPNRSGMVTDA